MKVKYRTPGSRRWAFFRYFDIHSGADSALVYLRRLRIVQTPWFGVYLHWINEPDSDRYPHDHPWHFWSLILRGKYSEVVYDSPFALQEGKGYSRTWKAGTVHSMKTTQAHRISEISDPLVTLVVTGRRVREWGFWTESGWLHWQKLPTK